MKKIKFTDRPKPRLTKEQLAKFMEALGATEVTPKPASIFEFVGKARTGQYKKD